MRRAQDTIGSILAEATKTLARALCPEPRRRARQVVGGSLGLEAAELLLFPDRELCWFQVERLHANIARLAKGEPLSRVLGQREFWGLNFELTPETLDPRPESETVIEAVLARVDRNAGPKLLDLGTGSGCLLLALLTELPSAYGVGVDLSPGAVVTARRNARSLGLAARAHFLVAEWGAALADRFDVIVTNPPYIATSSLAALSSEVREYDPRLALDGGEDGLAGYRSIAKHLSCLVTPAAIIAAEVGADQSQSVAQIFREHGLTIEAFERDLAGYERCIVARASAG